MADISVLVAQIWRCYCFFQSVNKQQQLQHQQFQQQMEEKLHLLQRQHLIFQPPDSDFLETAHIRSEGSSHSSPNITPRASNHSNLSQSETVHSANEHEEAGTIFFKIKGSFKSAVKLCKVGKVYFSNVIRGKPRQKLCWDIFRNNKKYYSYIKLFNYIKSYLSSRKTSLKNCLFIAEKSWLNNAKLPTAIPLLTLQRLFTYKSKQIMCRMKEMLSCAV